MIKADFELWKDIKGFEGLYQVSTWARVRSLDRYVTGNCGVKYFRKGEIKKPNINKYGYKRISLSKDGKQKKIFLHCLVAEAFIPNPDNLPCVNHKDEDKTNNYPCNLEYCTYKYNNNYGTRNERMKKTLTNRKDRSKKVYQYDFRGNLIKIWDSTMEASRNGFNFRNISACCLGNRKTHKGFIWSYTELS